MSRIPINIPNILTMARFALIPVVTILIYFDMMFLALAFFLLACITDMLDGYIARKKKLVTNEGAMLDPLADKLMAVFAVISFTVSGVLPTFILVILLIKELLMIGGAIFLYFRDIVVPSNIFGKIATFTFDVSVGFTFLHNFVNPWHIYFMYFALALMVAALFQYTFVFKRLREKKRLTGNEKTA